MRYVRTKDGRIEIVRFQSYDSQAKMVVDKDVKIETENLREADNIPDLCDYFWVIKNANEYLCELFDEDLGYVVCNDCDCNSFHEEECDKIYGIVKTSKGLFFVAEKTKETDWKLI